MFKTFLILILIRPFISSLAFPYLNFIYSYLFLGFLLAWITIKKKVTVTPFVTVTFCSLRAIKYPLILFSLALVISILLSLNKLNSFKELYKYVTGLSLFLIASSLNYKDKTRLIRVIVFAGFIISLLAIYQYFFGFKHILEYIHKAKITCPFALDYISRKRIFFPFVTPNTLAGYLIMIIPLALIYQDKILLIIPLFFALLLTQSLGALLSLLLGLLIYFYLRGKLKKRKILFLLSLLIITGVVFITRSITQLQHAKPCFSIMMRLNYWQETLKIIKAHPLTGVGLGNFNLPESRYSHNTYLQICSEIGILGIISFLWLVFSAFKIGLRNIQKKTTVGLLQNTLKVSFRPAICLFTANLIFLIHNLLDFTFFLPEVSLLWWVILGLLV